LNFNENFAIRPQFSIWCLTFGAHYKKNDGHYFPGIGGRCTDGLNETLTPTLAALHCIAYEALKTHALLHPQHPALFQQPLDIGGNFTRETALLLRGGQPAGQKQAGLRIGVHGAVLSGQMQGNQRTPGQMS